MAESDDSEYDDYSYNDGADDDTVYSIESDVEVDEGVSTFLNSKSKKAHRRSKGSGNPLQPDKPPVVGAAKQPNTREKKVPPLTPLFYVPASTALERCFGSDTDWARLRGEVEVIATKLIAQIVRITVGSFIRLNGRERMERYGAVALPMVFFFTLFKAIDPRSILELKKEKIRRQLNDTGRGMLKSFARENRATRIVSAKPKGPVPRMQDFVSAGPLNDRNRVKQHNQDVNIQYVLPDGTKMPVTHKSALGRLIDQHKAKDAERVDTKKQTEAERRAIMHATIAARVAKRNALIASQLNGTNGEATDKDDTFDFPIVGAPLERFLLTPPVPECHCAIPHTDRCLELTKQLFSEYHWRLSMLFTRLILEGVDHEEISRVEEVARLMYTVEFVVCLSTHHIDSAYASVVTATGELEPLGNDDNTPWDLHDMVEQHVLRQDTADCEWEEAPEVTSALNGSHGEATESDDTSANQEMRDMFGLDSGAESLEDSPSVKSAAVKQTSKRQNKRERQNVNAQAHQRERANNAKTKAKAEAKAKAMLTETEPDVEPIFIDVCIILETKGPSQDRYTWDGKDFYRHNGVHFASLTDNGALRALPKVQHRELFAECLGPGLYREHLQGNEEKNVTQMSCSAFLYKEMEDVSWIHGKKLCTMAGGDGYIFIPLLNVLKERFPYFYPSAANVAAMLAYATKQYPSCPTSFTDFTVHAYALETAERTLCANGVSATMGDLKALRVGEAAYVDPPGLISNNSTHKHGIRYDLDDFYRDYAVPCTKDFDDTDNGQWTVVKSNGVEMLENGDPMLPIVFKTLHNERPKWYRTVFFDIRGRGEANFCVYENDGENISKAFARLFKSAPEEAKLFMSQNAYAHDRVTSKHFDKEIVEQVSQKVNFREAAVLYSPSTDHQDMIRELCLDDVFSKKSYLHMFYDLMIAVIMLPVTIFMYMVYDPVAYAYDCYVHREYFKNCNSAKKALYITWLCITKYAQIMVDNEECESDPPIGKFKHEIGKWLKFGRIFVSYGRSILSTSPVYAAFKKRFCRRYDFSPFFDFAVVIDVLPGLGYESIPRLRPDGVYIKIFSDDSIMDVVYNGEVRHFDCDVNSNDSHNKITAYSALFTLLLQYTTKSRIATMIRRLQQPIRIQNPSNSSEFVVLKPFMINEGSGDGGTTSVNNVNCLLGYIEFALKLQPSGLALALVPDYKKLVSDGFAMIGHEVTCDEWESVQQQTLLKNFQVDVDGSRIWMLALGTIFRGLGKLDGDIDNDKCGVTATAFRGMTINNKMELYISNIIAGLCNEPGNVIMDALRLRFHRPTRAIYRESAVHTDQVDRSMFIVPVDQLQARYGGLESEYYQLAAEIADIKLGLRITNNLVGRFFNKDYGLTCEVD